MKALKSYLDSGKSEFVALYGRRRVGKTFLIRMAAEDKFSFYVTGVHDATKAEQLTAFAIAMQKYSGSERLNIQKTGFWHSTSFRAISSHFLKGKR